MGKDLSSTGPSPKIPFRVGKKKYLFTFEQAFSYAHTLLEKGHYALADAVLRALAGIRPADREVKILLARCEFELNRDKVCQQILAALFHQADAPIAAEYHDAFVYHKFGLIQNAIQEIRKIIGRHKDLPTACLFLGDLLMEAGHPDQAVECWQLAIRHDKDGPVAKAAEDQIRRRQKAEEGAAGSLASEPTEDVSMSATEDQPGC